MSVIKRQLSVVCTELDQGKPVICNPDTYPCLCRNSLTVDESPDILTVNNLTAVTERERVGQIYTLPYLSAAGFDFEANFHQVN